MNGKRVLKKPAKAGSLNTYFTSLLSVLLSGAMLLGTTWAWLSGDATSAGNRIHTGKFDVQLAHVTDGGSLAVLGGEGNHRSAFSNTRWTPGHTEIQTLRVTNTGTLKLRYKLDLVPPEQTTRQTAPGALSDLFTVYFKQGSASKTEALTQANGWQQLGSLTDVMDKEKQLVLCMDMDALNPRSSDTVSVALRLTDNTTQLASFMNQSLTVLLKLDAFQYTEADNTIN